jgi:autotransporter strand-loop-strand O-heptosyltransferase
VVKYLQEKGYEVVCIDKYANFGSGKNFNKIPENATNKTGELPLQERITDLLHCEFFIGLGSGLSWLAWSLNKPVILISGFSKPMAEFDTPYRVFNENVCNGCWNDENLKFDPSNWLWCPRNKNFECTKQITFQMVKEKIDLLI